MLAVLCCVAAIGISDLYRFFRFVSFRVDCWRLARCTVAILYYPHRIGSLSTVRTVRLNVPGTLSTDIVRK